MDLLLHARLGDAIANLRADSHGIFVSTRTDNDRLPDELTPKDNHLMILGPLHR